MKKVKNWIVGYWKDTNMTANKFWAIVNIAAGIACGIVGSWLSGIVFFVYALFWIQLHQAEQDVLFYKDMAKTVVDNNEDLSDCIRDLGKELAKHIPAEEVQKMIAPYNKKMNKRLDDFIDRWPRMKMKNPFKIPQWVKDLSERLAAVGKKAEA